MWGEEVTQQHKEIPRGILYFLGVILISLALLADGAIGNVQEKALKQYQGSNSEMVCNCFIEHSNIQNMFY